MKLPAGVIVAKPVSRAVKKEGNRRLWAMVCYYYPQYTLEEASKLNVRDIRLLLNTARREQAKRNLELVQIATAPHTKKGQGVQKLSNFFKQEMEK